MKKLKYISLFAGIGGFDLALNRLGHVCVWANEWDKYAAQIYNKNFIRPLQQEDTERPKERQLTKNQPHQREHLGNCDTESEKQIYRRNLCSEPANEKSEQTESEIQLGRFRTTLEEERSILSTDIRRVGTVHNYDIDTRDIRTVDTKEIPEHDLLVGGFPCQAFSIAGKRRGFDDTRGTLFFEIARILKDKQPKYFILENVKGLLSHDNGNTFKTIIATLTELGYDIQWQVLNSKNYGVPQNRERVFIVGHIRGQPRPEVFPITGGNEQDNTSRQSEITQCLTSNYYKQPNAGNYLKQVVGGSQGYRVYDANGISSTLAGEAGGVGAKTGLYAIPVLTPDRLTKRQNGRRFKEDGKPSFTLTGQDKHGVYDGMKIRRLTPTECERLQGFPDGWTEGISDTQRYKCLGNAVTVNVITAIAERLI